MINLKNIHPVTDFSRNTKRHIRALKRSGQPTVLTGNGEAEIVVQSAEGYQKLLDQAELAKSLAGLQRGLEQAKRGEGRPMREFLEEFAAKRGISLK